MKAILTCSFAIACAIFATSAMQYAYAETGATIADLQCAPEKGMCMYQQQCDPNKPKTPENTGVLQKPCKDTRGVNGHCVAYNICKADNAMGSNGKSMGVGDLSQLMGMLGQLMKSLGGGGGGGSGGGSGGTPGSGGCPQYYQVSTPSSDPCANYVPLGGNSIHIDTGTGANTNTNTNGNTTNIGDLIGGSGSSDTGSVNPISKLLNDLTGGGGNNASSNVNAATGTPGNKNTVGVSSSTVQGAANLGPGGANAEIRVLPNGATIVITNQNNASNSVTAGFLGNQAVGGMQPTGLVASWCRSRPWASNFLSFIIPATFFDSLCSLRGYQVGDVVQSGGPAEVGSSVRIQNPPQKPGVVPAATSSQHQNVVPQSPPMQVHIWAVPPTVPLGGRTTIFWNSKNAASCVETSPDGSFSHTSLAGGGATVPLSGATTFTISCMAPDGTHATDDVVVGLSL